MGVGLSLSGVRNMESLRKISTDFPDCSFELSYSFNPDLLEEAVSLLQGRIVSVHALTPKREFFPNLGWQGALSWSENEILKDAEYASSLGARRLVLHPGYAMKDMIYTDTEKRLIQVEKSPLKNYSIEGFPRIASPDYLNCAEYREAFEVMVENAVKVSSEVEKSGVELCFENLVPRPGYLFIHPKEMHLLSEKGLSLCLDTGHLQVSSAVFGFDPVTEACSIIETGAVKTMHVHSNGSRDGFYMDSHENPGLYIKDLKKLVDCARANGAELISEVKDDPYLSVNLLTSLY